MTPDAFIDIAKSHVIKPSFLKNSSRYGRPEQLILQPAVHEKGIRDGKACNVYNIRQGTGGEAFSSYVCDYGEGQLNYQVLSSEADFCFTITINGCTFSLGTAASDGTLIVSHTNTKGRTFNAQDKKTFGYDDTSETHSGRGWQASTQQAIAKSFHGSGSYIDGTVYYANGDVNVMVFGVRVASKWAFYYQTFRRSQGAWEHMGFYDFAAQSKSF